MDVETRFAHLREALMLSVSPETHTVRIRALVLALSAAILDAENSNLGPDFDAIRTHIEKANMLSRTMVSPEQKIEATQLVRRIEGVLRT